MEGPEANDRAAADLPSVVYRRIRAQVQATPQPSASGFGAAIFFVLATMVLLIVLEIGIDLQQVLAAIVVIVLLNLVVGVVWVTRSQRAEEDDVAAIQDATKT
jgi:hypothetical protein